MPFGNAKVQRPGRKLLIAAMAATFGMGLSGCNDDNNSSNTGGNTGNTTSPKGTIIGSVVDTNGNFITGATVRIGSLTATTNAGGQYEFRDVAVNTAVTNSGNGTSAGNSALPISISGPAGYLSGTFEVTVNSQVTCSSGANNQLPNVGGDTNPQCVLIDGFNVGAGAAVLPRTNSTVTGTLRDKVTGLPIPNQVLTLDFRKLSLDQTPQAVLAIGYSGVGEILATTTDANGVFTFANVASDSCYTLQSSIYDLTSTNNPTGGPCTPPQPPTDRDPSTILFATTNEGSNTTNLRSVLATIVSNGDFTSPFVTDVEGVLDGTLNPGQLANGVNTTFVVNFSEPVLAGLAAGAQLSANDVIVTSGSATNPEFITSSATVVDANTISVVIATPPAPLAVGKKFSIALRSDKFVDGSSNVLALNLKDDANGQNPGPGADTSTAIPPVNYDDSTSRAGYITLNLQVFQPLDTNTNGSAGTQVITPVNPTTDNFFNATAALADFIDGNSPRPGQLLFRSQFNNTVTLPVTGFEQLNAVFPVGAGQNHPLLALIDALGDRTTGSGLPVNILDVNTAAVDVTFGTADHYVAWVEDRQGNVLRNVLMNVSSNNPLSGTDNPRIVGVLDKVVTTADGDPVPKSFSSVLSQVGTACEDALNSNAGNASPCPLFVIAKGTATAAKLYIRDAAVVLTNVTNGNTAKGNYNPVGLLPDPNTPATLVPGATLHLIARTKSGFTGNEQVIPLNDVVKPTAGAQFYSQFFGAQSSANGGNTGSGGTTINVVNNVGQVIFPITPQALDVTDTTNSAGTGLSADSLRETGELLALSNAGLAANLALINASLGTVDSVSDATGTAAFLSTPNRRLGLVVTEPVIVGTGAPVLSTGFTATVTPQAAINADSNGVDELTNPVNLVPFDTNVLSLEADGRAKRTIDFSAVFTDKASTPNQASKAIVQVRDFLPPIMTKAFFDGSQLVFRFSEGVKSDGAQNSPEITFTTPGCNVTIDLDTPQAAFTLDQNATRLRVPVSVANNGVSMGNPAIAGGVVNASCFSSAAALAYAEPGQLDLATLTAAGDTALTQVAAAPAHGGVRYANLRDLADNRDIDVPNATAGNSWGVWAGRGLGMGQPTFAIANVVPPFLVSSIVPVNFVVPTAGGNAPGNNGTQVTFTVTFTGPVFIADPTAGTGMPNDVNAQDADETTGVSNNNAVVDQNELTAYFDGKFEVVNLVNASKATLNSATLSRSQNGVPVNTFGNDGTVLTLVYTLTGNVASGDRFRLRGTCGTFNGTLVTGETASCAISGAIDPAQQFVIRDDTVAPVTAREVAPRIVP